MRTPVYEVEDVGIDDDFGTAIRRSTEADTGMGWPEQERKLAGTTRSLEVFEFEHRVVVQDAHTTKRSEMILERKRVFYILRHYRVFFERTVENRSGDSIEVHVEKLHGPSQIAEVARSCQQGEQSRIVLRCELIKTVEILRHLIPAAVEGIRRQNQITNMHERHVGGYNGLTVRTDKAAADSVVR